MRRDARSEGSGRPAGPALPLRIAVASDIEADSPRAHAINVFKTAGGFTRLGHDVTVLCRPAANLDATASAGAAASLYAEPGLRWRFAPPHPGHSRAERFGEWAVARAAELGADLVYARHFMAAVRCADAGLTTIVETHAHIGDANPELVAALFATARAHRPIAALTTISRRLADHYAERGAAPARVHVVPDGVDVELFQPPRESHAPPWGEIPGPHAVYAGHLYDYKGIPTILDAAALLPRTTFHLVGGLSEDVSRVRDACTDRALHNVLVHGPRPHAEVPRWLWPADVLLLPPSADHPSAAWTSPVKLGEYLAAGPPIVASAIPALRDWVGEPEVIWFAPDDPADLARAIAEAVRETPERRRLRTAVAQRLARAFSYPSRARAMLSAAGLSPARRAAEPLGSPAP